MPNVLIVGSTRGLGASLANIYASKPETTVYGTTRSPHPPKATEIQDFDEKIAWIPHIDVSQEGCGKRLVNSLGMLGGGGGVLKGVIRSFDVVIITAGYFATEDFVNGPDWEAEVNMYKTSAISPPFIVHSLFRAKYLAKGAKILIVSSESGSITLRHEKEGGGNYGHHASKAATNMVGKLLSLDLKEKGVIVSIVHPGFMRTGMTEGVGFDKYWDDGGAVYPDEAAKSLVEWVGDLTMEKTGQYWAPRGPRDIGTADVTMGSDLPTPLQLPW
ncbi:oxidoreductase-like protein [Calycina marina]|uniref:Oxidoreductase-like protein n=1 Tax=Calycina marina TaxID=1763456 RepID=A0A9P7Z4Y7_9HELO|nr:oxidoreductase-like protein [Calycina marina]